MNAPAPIPADLEERFTVGDFLALVAVDKDGRWDAVRAGHHEVNVMCLADHGFVRILFDDSSSDVPSHVEVTPEGAELLR